MNRTLKTIILFAMLALSFSCQDEDKESFEACGVVNPAENLAWMKAEIEGWKTTNLYTYFYITQGDYLGQTVFLLQNCCPFCDSITPVLDCNGELLWYAPMEPDKTSQITDKRVVWKPFGSECNI